MTSCLGQSGNTFSILHDTDGTSSRSCDITDGTDKGGCQGGTW